MKVFTTIEDGLTVVTGAPEKVPTVMPGAMGTDGTTEGPASSGTPATVKTNTEEDKIPVAATVATEPFSTELPVKTAAPAAATEEARAEVTAPAEAEPKNEVVIEEGTDEASGEKRR